MLLPRRIHRQLLAGVRFVSGGVILMLMIAAIAAVVAGAMSIGVAIAVVVTLAFTIITLAATIRRREPPPLAAVRVSSDGITAMNEHFERFYAWGDIVGAKRDYTELVLMVEGGYAFRVPFRDIAKAQAALARIRKERAARERRLEAEPRRQHDAVEPGDEPRWIDRQRQRLATGYRHGHAVITDIVDELADPDFPLQARLGSAIALSECTDPTARAAMETVSKWTASRPLGEAIDALVEGRASNDMLIGWTRMMHPTLREIAPVAKGGSRIEVTPPRARISTSADGPEEEALAEEEATAGHEETR